MPLAAWHGVKDAVAAIVLSEPESRDSRHLPRLTTTCVVYEIETSQGAHGPGVLKPTATVALLDSLVRCTLAAVSRQKPEGLLQSPVAASAWQVVDLVICHSTQMLRHTHQALAGAALATANAVNAVADASAAGVLLPVRN